MPPDSRFTVGDRVLVTAGMNRGLVGVIRGLSQFGPWQDDDGLHAMWRVQLDGEPRESHITETSLVPEPTKSDDDVMSPLRNVTSGRHS